VQAAAQVWKAISDDCYVESVQIELGLVRGEGNIFVSRAKAVANLTVTLSVGRGEP
jgi:hypothetical protein